MPSRSNCSRKDCVFGLDVLHPGSDSSEGHPGTAVWEAPVNLEVGRASWAGNRDLVDMIALGVVVGRKEVRSPQA